MINLSSGTVRGVLNAATITGVIGTENVTGVIGNGIARVDGSTDPYLGGIRGDTESRCADHAVRR